MQVYYLYLPYQYSLIVSNALDFVSLASALISIILAVITIIYSFYSNSQSASQVETLNKATYVLIHYH